MARGRGTNGIRARAILVLSGLIAGSALHPALAVDDADRAGIRAVIDTQIRAFRADDGPAAHALASPALRQIFPSPEIFMEMVRQGYRPVYRPRSYRFEEPRDAPGGIEQNVRIDDENGIGWTALYTLERQEDGSWAISGCRLVRAADQAV